MNFYKIIKKVILFNLFTLNVILASDEFGLSDFPNEIIQNISSYLIEEENWAFRQTAKRIMKNVDQVYITKIGKNFNNLESSILADEAEKNKDFSLFRYKYIYNIASNKCKAYLEKHKYLCVSQGSIFEGYLAKNYTRVPLYEYLQNQPEISKNLYNKLFGKEIPEDQYDLAVKLLTGCLPANHIYVSKETKAEEYPQLLNKFQSQLAQAIQGNKFKYFLLGIDKNYEDLDETYHIVINQSNLECLPQLDNRSYNTIIFNADQAELSFRNPPKNMKKLILVNGNKLCTSIGSYFLPYCSTLTHLDTKGLVNLCTIGNDFLTTCKILKDFDTKGLINLQTIGNEFLFNCSALENFDTTHLTNLCIIGNNFLFGCKNLKNFNTAGLIKVKKIGKDFLFFCGKIDGVKIKEMLLQNKK